MGFREKLKQRREHIKKVRTQKKLEREQRNHMRRKQFYAKNFKANKQRVVLQQQFLEKDMMAVLESAEEHGYKLISNNPIALGFASELIFEKA